MSARTCRHLAVLVLVAFLLAACGNKGPLIKPAPASTAPAQAAPAQG